MVIRFHCLHCDQRLSVQDNKANSLAKCPTCKRILTVPSKQQAAAQAASRRAAEAEEVQQAAQSAVEKTTAEKAPKPAPAPERTRQHEPGSIRGTVASEAPVESSVDELAPSITSSRVPRPREPVGTGTMIDVPGVAGHVAVGSVTIDAPETPEYPVEDLPPQVATPVVSPVSRVGINYRKVAVSRGILIAQGVLLATVGVTCFLLGIVAGTARNSDDAMELATPRTITGKVWFEDGSGRLLTDDNCVVILLPEEKLPEMPIEARLLVPDQPLPAADNPSLTSIEVLGGAYVRTNTEGEFSVQLPSGGNYYALVISANQTADNADRPKDHTVQMRRYFASVSELLGDHAYRWQKIPVRSDRVLNFKFERT